MKLPTREQLLKTFASWTAVTVLAMLITSVIAVFILGDHDHKGGGGSGMVPCAAKPCFAKLSDRIDRIERDLAARTKLRYTSEDATTDKRAIYDAIRAESAIREAQIASIVRAMGDLHSKGVVSSVPHVPSKQIQPVPIKITSEGSKWFWFWIGVAPGVLLGMFITSMFAGGSRGERKS